jgi:hypothetical protein
MHPLVRFAHTAAGNGFTTAEIHPAVIEELGCDPEHYMLASLSYDLLKLRAKGLVAKLPNSRRYQRRDTRFASSSWSSSNASTRHSPQASSAPSKHAHGFNPKGDRNLSASIRALSMISIPSFAPSASKPHDKGAKREQNPRYTCDNGLTCASHSAEPEPTMQHRAHRSERPMNHRSTRRTYRAAATTWW